jgi:hypothetical protein
MGKKGRKDVKKEAKQQLATLLEQSKDFIQQKCAEALQARNADELRYWNQKLTNPHLIHTQAIEIAGQQENVANLKLLYTDFIQKYSSHAITIMHTSVLTHIDANFSSKQTEMILDTLKIDLKHIPPIPTFSNIEGPTLRGITPILMELVHNKWKENREEARQILELFVSKNLPLQEPTLSDNAMLRCTTQYHEDIEFIQMLLESRHFDVNTAITPKTPDKLTGKLILARTAFSIAFSHCNIELMQLLLEYGADPYLAAKESKLTTLQQSGSRMVLPPEIAEQAMVVHQIGFEKLSPSEQQQHYLNATLLIKNFFLKKAEELANKSLQQAEQRHAKELKKQAKLEALAQKKVADAEKASSSGAIHKEAQSQELMPKGAPADADAQTTRTPELQISETELLNRYIESEEIAANNKQLPQEVREESKFDSLVLRYIQTRDNSTLDEIAELLSGPHSAKNSGYYVKVLTELDTSIEDAGEILATMPKLLHKFCTVQKEIQSNASVAAEPEEQSLGDNVYPVSGTKIFLQIDPELITRLPEDQLAKIQSQLSNPKFIAKNSLGISGVKDYGRNISKLKIAQIDENLVSTIRYKDVQGNLLIVFNQFLSHKETEALKRGECITVEHIQEAIYPVSTEDTALDMGDLLSSTAHPNEPDEVELGGEDC